MRSLMLSIKCSLFNIFPLFFLDDKVKKNRCFYLCALPCYKTTTNVRIKLIELNSTTFPHFSYY